MIKNKEAIGKFFIIKEIIVNDDVAKYMVGVVTKEEVYEEYPPRLIKL